MENLITCILIPYCEKIKYRKLVENIKSNWEQKSNLTYSNSTVNIALTYITDNTYQGSKYPKMFS